MAVNSLEVLEQTINREELLQKAKEVGELAEKYVFKQIKMQDFQM